MLTAIKNFFKWVADWFANLSDEEKMTIIMAIVNKTAWLFSLYYEHCMRKREEAAQSNASSSESSDKEGAAQ